MTLKLRQGEKTDLEDAFFGTCKNCGKETWVRREEIKDMMFKEISRGYADLCFKCFGPRILWKSKERGNMRSPANIPLDELDRFLEDYFKSRDKHRKRSQGDAEKAE